MGEARLVVGVRLGEAGPGWWIGEDSTEELDGTPVDVAAQTRRAGVVRTGVAGVVVTAASGCQIYHGTADERRKTTQQPPSWTESVALRTWGVLRNPGSVFWTTRQGLRGG
ncbi:hypothetical protein Pmani_036763 [Petrolisthes manimaculis]|uniref:Uncharacterized protein n=1 Tax=Petrolisthes manimaculis TaxID=1843537 RepID=A0AAE1NJ08_9EUCA|nr:hypothetical protein Pmani_036763 [Petrolisthes manimaculis]